MSKIYLNSEEAWNLLCKTVFEYHENERNKLDEQQQIKYLEDLSELEFKIYHILKIGGVVNPELALHKDFPKVWEFVKNKLQRDLTELMEKDSIELPSIFIEDAKRDFYKEIEEQKDIEEKNKLK